MTYVVNKPSKFRHLFSPTYCTCMNYESRYFRFALTYIFSFPFAVWKMDSLKFKMSKHKTWETLLPPWVSLNRKIIHQNMKFQQARGNLLFSWKNGFAQWILTWKKLNWWCRDIYNSWHCSVLTFSSRLPFTCLNVSKLTLILAEV